MLEIKKRSIIRYIINNLYKTLESDFVKVSRTLFLIDSYNKEKYGGEGNLTGMNWYVDELGPFSKDLYNEIDKDNSIKVQSIQRKNGIDKDIIVPKNNKDLKFSLEEKDKEVIDNVLNKVVGENILSLTRLVKESCKNMELK